jgi:hypothetical protein
MGSRCIYQRILYVNIFEGELSASCPCLFTPNFLLIVGRVGPRAGLDDVERRKILPLPGLRTPIPQLSNT